MKTKLVMHQLEIEVSLGWGEEERSQKQIVWVDLHIDFKNPPKATETDHLDDTYCYHTLAHRIVKNISEREFRLIEHLSFEIYTIAKTFFGENALTQAGVTKKPDISYPNQGVTFWYGDGE
jgi:7,8-dihydroneopterin aldolase/epimerase/oxygenase